MYKKRLLYLIVACSIIRIVLACLVELGNDEVYYYTYALHLQKNYFDHPPGVGLLIRLFTFNLVLQQQLFIRLGAIACAAIATWMVFNIGKLIRNERTGWFTAVLYSTSLYSSIIAGTFILPDSPQVVFWLAALWAGLRIIIAYRNNSKATYSQWLLFGLLTGLCVMCKVHGIFLWAGLGLYMLLYNRKMFLHPAFYVSAIITIIIISPIFIWNVENNFITWRYHSERVIVERFAVDIDSFIQVLLGQIFYNNPLNIFILIAGLVYGWKNKIVDCDISRLLSLMGFPIIIAVTGIALFRSVLPHWSGPGFLTLSFIGAAFLDSKLQVNCKAVLRSVLTASAVFIIVLAVAGTAAIRLYPGTIGSKKPSTYGDNDFTLDMQGWSQFGAQFRLWQNEAIAKKEIAAGLPIVCNKWFPAAHIEYYVARQANSYVVGVGNLNDLHQYVWLNHYRPTLQPGNDAICIIPSNYPVDVQVAYSPHFQSTKLLHTFTETRSGQTTRYINVYLLTGYMANDEAGTYKVQ